MLVTSRQRFSLDDDRLVAELLAFISRPYTPAERERLERVLSGASPEEYCRIAFDLGPRPRKCESQNLYQDDREPAAT